MTNNVLSTSFCTNTRGFNKFFDSKNCLYLQSSKALHFLKVHSSNFYTTVHSTKPLLEAIGPLNRSDTIDTVDEGLNSSVRGIKTNSSKFFFQSREHKEVTRRQIRTVRWMLQQFQSLLRRQEESGEPCEPVRCLGAAESPWSLIDSLRLQQ